MVGPLDDAIMAALVLRHVLRRTDRSVLADHWRGDPSTLDAIIRMGDDRPTAESLNFRLKVHLVVSTGQLGQYRAPARHGEPAVYVVPLATFEEMGRGLLSWLRVAITERLAPALAPPLPHPM